VSLAECLSRIAELLADEEIPFDERALRLRQYTGSARGIYCPEVAFDPLAIRLRAIAQRRRVRPPRRLRGRLQRRSA
jgi:hypothetical protein